MNNNVNAHYANNDMFSNYKSDSNSQVSDSMKLHFDVMLTAFSNAGKGVDSVVTKTEVVDLLDSRTKNKRFDRTLINKLFTIIDDDSRNDTCLVSVFIKNYIYLEEEMKQNMQKYEQLLAKEKVKNEEYAEKKELALRSEIVNEEGLSDKSTITITFIEVIPNKIDDANYEYEAYVVQSKYLDQVQYTSEFGLYDVTNLQQEFTFKLQTLRSEIEFVLFGKRHHSNVDNDDNDNDEYVPLGNVKFPLDKLEKEENFSVKIKIPELHNEHNTILDINASLNCYWSDVFNYTEEKNNSDEKLVKIKEKLNKTKFYLNALLEPLEYSNANMKQNKQHNNADVLEPIMELKETNEVNTGDVYKESVCENKQLQLIENKIKETFNINIIDWNNIIQVCSIILCICSVLSLYRNDYIGITGACAIMCINRLTKGKNDMKQVMNMIKGTIGVAIGMVVMDVMWLVMNIVSVFKGVDVYKGGNENGILRVSVLLCVCNIVVKAVVIVGGLIQYNKVSYILKSNK